MTTPLLHVSNLACIRNDRLLFKQLNFSAHAGELWHIAGPNGCGKSSLLQIMVGLLTAQAGQVNWADDFAYVGHKQGIKNGLTVLENLHLQAELSLAALPVGWEGLLAKLSLTGLEHVLCQRLSAGQRQRAALARLLILNPKIWVLDEPFTAIDHDGVANLHQLLDEHVKRGGLVLLTSHQALNFNDLCVKRLELSA